MAVLAIIMTSCSSDAVTYDTPADDKRIDRITTVDGEGQVVDEQVIETSLDELQQRWIDNGGGPGTRPCLAVGRLVDAIPNDDNGHNVQCVVPPRSGCCWYA